MDSYVFAFLLCFLIFSLSMIASSFPKREGFTPKWLRVNKNNTLRKFRRGIKPYYDDFFNRMHQLRRKWL